MSNRGYWDEVYKANKGRIVEGDDTTLKIAADIMSDCDLVEDWGSGWGGFKNYLQSHQKYRGIDGSKNLYTDLVFELESYRSYDADGILIRHVLENNVQWAKILENAVNSYKHKLCIVISTPMILKTKIISKQINFKNSGDVFIDIAFALNDLLASFNNNYLISSHKFNIRTNSLYGVEHIYTLIK